MEPLIYIFPVLAPSSLLVVRDMGLRTRSLSIACSSRNEGGKGGCRGQMIHQRKCLQIFKDIYNVQNLAHYEINF